ncbi:MAG: glycosyltransferase [Planctomycetota bacterium]|nr:glycosyltransferase [Planctomycetota bacterium]
MPNILIAGGGSGGHVAPAIAAAEELYSRGYGVLLVHSNRSIDDLMVERSPFQGVQVPAAPASLKPFKAVKFCVGFVQSFRMIQNLIQDKDIKCVLATGGFVAAPALKAASSVGCPTVLLNIDDPPGKANRLAVRWANQTLSTVPCKLDNVILIDPPLRNVAIAPMDAAACKNRLGINDQLQTLLVTGASQGARTINELICELTTRFPTNFQGWQIMHITGAGNEEQIRERWKSIDVPCKVLGFHHEMGDAWGAADLAITRGGANTIAEIAMNNVPTIVMPYPFHKDNHQRKNATPLQKIGGIKVVTDHKMLQENLLEAGELVLELINNHHARACMRQAMIDSKPKNGVNAIADTCTSFIKAT